MGKSKREYIKYDPDFRIKVVKTSLEKNLDAKEMEQLYGVKIDTWRQWKRLYKRGGEKALRGGGQSRKTSVSKADKRYREHILQAKQQFPFFGIGRIWHWLRRTLALPVSRGEIQKTLKDEGLLTAKEKKRSYKRKIKHFERSLPNQLWQSDITIFTIARGLRVYLIGFMGDLSRKLCLKRIRIT